MFSFSCVIKETDDAATLEGNTVSVPVPVPTFQPSFRLPIEYLQSDHIHSLSPIVSNDLELVSVEQPSDSAMYNILFQPSHSFAKRMIPQWSKSHTTNIEYLTETQNLIKSADVFSSSQPESTCEKLEEIWDAIKNDSSFLERYSYMEWDMLKFLNTNASFLQSVTIANMISPVMCFLLPVLFLIFPFVILKLKGIPIDIATYIEVLTEIAKKHFIGQIIMRCKEMDMQNMIYMMAMAGLYFYQIYQNYVVCVHFYERITKVNEYLNTTKEFVAASISNIDKFLEITKSSNSYQGFNRVLLGKRATLAEIQENLSEVRPFCVSLSKVVEIGGLLKHFYLLYDTEEYYDALYYTFEFEGYLDNLRGVNRNLESGAIAVSSYTTLDVEQEMLDQYYPSLIQCSEPPIKNSCGLDKNLLITGPNASGKTTLLKTTLINIIFTQQVGCGFYSACKLHPYDHIHSYLNIPDTSGRDSLFQAESRRCKEIIDAIDGSGVGGRHFAIFDELYSGTNPEEASKSAYAFLLYLNGRPNVTYMLTTHYLKVCKRLRKTAEVRCLKMAVETFEDGGALKYLYRAERGISKVQGAVRVLKSMDYPSEILETIYRYDNKK